MQILFSYVNNFQNNPDSFQMYIVFARIYQFIWILFSEGMLVNSFCVCVCERHVTRYCFCSLIG